MAEKDKEVGCWPMTKYEDMIECKLNKHYDSGYKQGKLATIKEFCIILDKIRVRNGGIMNELRTTKCDKCKQLVNFYYEKNEGSKHNIHNICFDCLKKELLGASK